MSRSTLVLPALERAHINLLKRLFVMNLYICLKLDLLFYNYLFSLYNKLK